MNNILYQVAEETLENLAFIFSFGDEEEPQNDSEQMDALRVFFSGEFSGELVMRMSKEVLPELAANMLGLDEEDIAREDQLDAASETLNVICGNLLPAIAGRQAIFNITSPEILSDVGNEIEKDIAATKASVRLPLENGCCELFLRINGDVSVGSAASESAK
jgi:chemotaxis protein CheY-P-specific phosphatase CheC